MTLPYKLLAALIMFLSAFGIGYWKGSGQVVEKIVKEQGETKTIVQDHIITKTIVRNPDGTTTETTKDETIAKQEETHTSKVATETGPNSAGAGGRYKLGLQYWAGSSSDILRPTDWKSQLGIQAGYNVFGPIWIDGEIRPWGHKEAALGFSFQF